MSDRLESNELQLLVAAFSSHQSVEFPLAFSSVRSPLRGRRNTVIAKQPNKLA